MSGKRILVTGAAGFIGSNLVQALLDDGNEVIGLDNLSAGTRENIPKGCEFRLVDICAPKLEDHFENVHTVFHLAAKNCLADCAANPVDTARSNVMGTANVLNACLDQQVQHIVYSDTSAEYEGVHEFPSKVGRIRPLSVYACSKRGGALMCESFQHLHGLPVSYVRYFNVYGPAQDWRRVIPPVMSAFTIALLEGRQPVIYGDGSKSRDFIHVDDVNAFHLKLLNEEKLRQRTYNLGSGVDSSIREIYDLIEGELKTGMQPQMLPDLPAEAQRTLADISETLSTGWKPQVSLKDGVRRFIEYTKKRLQDEQSLPAERTAADKTLSENP